MQVHGGPDARGVAAHDFSTNANACGPCPQALAAVQQCDASRYPDPASTALRERLAAWHGVAADRIVVAASASEFIYRITVHAVLQGVRAVALPAHSYGDYQRAALACGLHALRPEEAGEEPTMLHWACEPSSPLGLADPALAHWRQAGPAAGVVRVVDCAYAALRLAPGDWDERPTAAPQGVWQLWSPNKALGLTGVRAAYAVAPANAEGSIEQLNRLAPSWPLGAHGVALLQAWCEPATQQWLAASHATLRTWKHRQQALCTALGWAVQPASLANFFAAQPRQPRLAQMLEALRAQGIQLRECSSFGLPGWLRLGVLPPASQDALYRAVKDMA